jgi:hypothetical protein
LLKYVTAGIIKMLRMEIEKEILLKWEGLI